MKVLIRGIYFSCFCEMTENGNGKNQLKLALLLLTKLVKTLRVPETKRLKNQLKSQNWRAF